MAATAKETWKALERRICKEFGGRRTPLSGSNSMHGTSSDCIETDYPWLYIEIKLKAAFYHHTLFKDAMKMAQTEHYKKQPKTPILITHVKSEESALVTLRIEDFLAMLHAFAEKEIAKGGKE